jgi:hypothetical protein
VYYLIKAMENEDNYFKYFIGILYLKKPELITYFFDKDNFLEIVYNIPCNFVNYLIDKHDDKIKELLNKIMDKDNYTKYKYIGLYILNKKPEFIIDNVKKYIC